MPTDNFSWKLIIRRVGGEFHWKKVTHLWPLGLSVLGRSKVAITVPLVSFRFHNRFSANRKSPFFRPARRWGRRAAPGSPGACTRRTAPPRTRTCAPRSPSSSLSRTASTTPACTATALAVTTSPQVPVYFDFQILWMRSLLFQGADFWKISLGTLYEIYTVHQYGVNPHCCDSVRPKSGIFSHSVYVNLT